MDGAVVAFGAEMRRQFVLEPGSTFVNHGSYGSVPRRVLEYRLRLIEQQESQPDLWFREKCSDMWRENKLAVSEFLGSSPDNLVFVHNTTTGVNDVLRSLKFNKGDALLINTYTYSAVADACRHTADRHDLELITLDLPSPFVGAGLNHETVVAAFDRVLSAHPNIRFVILDYISSRPAMLMPVKELISVCRRHNVMIFVDGAHTPGQIQLDLENLGADFFAGNLHKWAFVPRGCAVLWVHPDHQRYIFPTVTSRYSDTDFEYNFSYQGTDDNSQYYTAKAAVQFCQDVGGHNAIAQYNTELVTRAADLLVSKWGTKQYPLPDEMKAPFMRQIRLPDLQKYPNEAKDGMFDKESLMRDVWHRFKIQALFFQQEGQPWIRMSTMVYNTIEDYKKLADAILTLKAEETDLNDNL